MKLKGKSVKKIKKQTKKKMEKTLKIMKETREADNIWLRELLKGKREWAKQEIQKGKTRIKTIQTQINRLEGIILLANDILEPQNENEPNGKKDG